MDNIQLSDLGSLVSKLTENPAALSAITNMISAMGKSQPTQSAPAQQVFQQSSGGSTADLSQQPQTTQTPVSQQKNDSPLNPELLSSLLGIVSQMNSGRTPDSHPSHAPSMPVSSQGGSQGANEAARKHGKQNPGFSINNIFGTPDEIKNRIMLLNSVRPYLSEPRRQKLEAIIKLLRLAELGGLNSLFSGN